MPIEPEVQKNVGEIEIENDRDDGGVVVYTVTFGVLDAEGNTIATKTKTISLTSDGGSGSKTVLKGSDFGGVGLGCYKVNNVKVKEPASAGG